MPDAHQDTLYLVDGSGFIFRAYYGVRAPMSAADGTPTNAVFGFVRLLVNLLRDREPAHVAVVFDPPGPSFRKEIYEPYKANRLAPPEDLIPQFALCRQAVVALNIPSLEVDRYEADDVIGTLARVWAETGRPCVIVTADKDLMQLVSEGITLWDGKEKTTDRGGVIERFGVPPERVIDLLGLAGDSSDNIPGVPGIGEKTAARMLQEHGDLEGLLAAASGIKGKRGASLIEFAEQARLSARLATIALDAPISLDEAAVHRTPPDLDVLCEFLGRLNMRQFLKEFGLARTSTVDRSGYWTVQSELGLDAVVEAIRRAGRLSLDLETTGLDTLTADIVGFALCWAPGEAVYVPVAHEYPGAPPQLSLATALEKLGPLIEDAALPKLGQNVKYEWQVLRRAGLEYRGIAADSMLAAYLLDPGRPAFKLDDLALAYLAHTMIAFRDVAGDKRDAQFARVPLPQATAYAAEDADVALRLCDEMLPQIEKEGLRPLNENVELPLAVVLAGMERQGIKLDADLLREQSAAIGVRIDALEAEIHGLAGEAFNIGSTKQLAELLFEKLGLPVDKKTKSGYSTDQGVLERLAPLHPLPARVLDYRHLTKLKNTYLDTLPALVHPATGRVHTSFRQIGAATGRIASTDPNLQNIPVRTEEGRAIRRAFVAERGWRLLSADYSQVELRLLAHISGDPGLLAAFAEGADVHARTASEMFGVAQGAVTPDQRRQAKAINFGLMYGMGPFRLGNELGVSQAEARKIIDRYFTRYRGVRAYIDGTIETARRTQKVTTLLGRQRHIRDINAKGYALRQAAERVAINTPIQGTAADLIKLAMVNLDRRLRAEDLDSRILLTVHDELVLEVPERELLRTPDIVREEMERVFELRVPLRVDLGIGDHWAEIH